MFLERDSIINIDQHKIIFPVIYNMIIFLKNSFYEIWAVNNV